MNRIGIKLVLISHKVVYRLKRGNLETHFIGRRYLVTVLCSIIFASQTLIKNGFDNEGLRRHSLLILNVD